MDLISVIVAVYNAENYLNRAVDSILNQTYKNIEVILVDDGSTDRSAQICDDYVMADNRVRVIHKGNGGLCSSRNAGIESSNGKYITFVDNDDAINEQFIEILHEVCVKYGCDIAQCDFLMTLDDSVFLPPQKTMTVNIYDRGQVMHEFCKESNLVKYWVVWNKMYRRELFRDIRYPTGRIHDDMFTTHRLLWEAEKVAVINLYLHYYFQRAGSITGVKSSIKERIDVIDALREEMNFFKERGLEDEYAFMLIKLYCTICEVYKNKNEYSGYEEDKSFYDDVMQKYFSEAQEIKNIFLNLPQKGILTKIRTIYPTLSKDEKDKLEHIYGSRISQFFDNAFCFPVNKINENELVALYGAGRVGKSYYSQLLDDKYCRLAVWVDNGFKNHRRQGLPVQPIDALFRNNFDKLIIAVQERSVAKEIADNLTGWGIPESKIIIDLPVPVDRGSKMLSEFKGDTEKISSYKGIRRWFLVNTPDHDNLGDHLLTMGALNFLHDHFPGEEIVEITGRQWDACRDVIISKIGILDVIVIVGGGYMGDLWSTQDSRVKEIMEEFRDNRILFFPQTFYYQGKEGFMMNSDREFYNSFNQVFFIHREKKSYDFFVSNIVMKNRNACFPDTALYLDGKNNQVARSGGLFCLRMDKESLNEKARENLLDIFSVACDDAEIFDTVLDKSVIKSERNEEITKILDKISRTEILLTDRLHAMIMAVITGTPCIALDNLSKKVSGVYEWIKDIDYVTCVDVDDVNEDLIREYKAKKDNVYDRSVMKHYFDKMAKKIKEWMV